MNKSLQDKPQVAAYEIRGRRVEYFREDDQVIGLLEEIACNTRDSARFARLASAVLFVLIGLAMLTASGFFIWGLIVGLI